MRHATGGLVLASTLAALGGLGLQAGCSREATPPVQPAAADEPPPLPPASGSPIGYLLDDTRLTLRDDQRTKLKEIDAELAGKLAYLDSLVRNAGPSAAPAKTEAKGGGSFTIAGEREDSQVGKTSSPKVTANTSPGGGLTPAQAAENAATVKGIPNVRAHDVRAAVGKALAVLDRDQQKIARQVLVDRGVDPDTGQFQAKGEPGAARRDEK